MTILYWALGYFVMQLVFCLYQRCQAEEMHLWDEPEWIIFWFGSLCWPLLLPIFLFTLLTRRIRKTMTKERKWWYSDAS